MDNIKLILFGHDHVNDYNTTYYGLGMSYGVKTGYGSYGPKMGMERGAKMVHIEAKDNDFEYTFENFY